jgi:hypothetical protein
MSGAMRDALELIRSLKKQYPDETEDQLVSRFQIHDEPVDGQKSGILVGSYQRQLLAKLANDLGRLGEIGNGGFFGVLRKHTGLN